MLACVATPRVGEADVALLHNGALLEGRIAIDGARITVRGDDSEVVLRRDRVAFVGADARAAYAWRRARMLADRPTVADRLDLAEWAMRQRLWPEAGRELLGARRKAPDSARLRLLEERLRHLAAPPPTRSAIAARDASRGSVVPASFEAPVNAEQSNRRDASDDSLEGLEVSDELLQRFTRRVQPVLVNSCTAGGCHNGEAGDPMPLDRSLLHGYADARSTARNLRSTLAAIDLEEPAESLLLRATRGPHQGVQPIRGVRRQEILDRIELWTLEVAAANRPFEAELESTAAEVAPSETVEPVDTTTPAPTPVAPRRLAVTPRLRRIEPRDEFDPEEFNRRFGPDAGDASVGALGD